MTKDQYIRIMSDPQGDMMPVYHFYFSHKGGKHRHGKLKGQSLSFAEFKHVFSVWALQGPGVFMMEHVQKKVIGELNKYFKI